MERCDIIHKIGVVIFAAAEKKKTEKSAESLFYLWTSEVSNWNTIEKDETRKQSASVKSMVGDLRS